MMFCVWAARHTYLKTHASSFDSESVFFHNDMQNRVMERMLQFLNSGEKHFVDW